MTDEFDFSNIAKGDVVTFRCDGEATIAERSVSDCRYYPIGVRFENFLASTADAWPYDKHGEHGAGTGIDGECPFDIINIKRKALSLAPLTKDEDDED